VLLLELFLILSGVLPGNNMAVVLELYIVLSEGGDHYSIMPKKLSIVTYIRFLASGIGDGPFAR
jgi:hypothetical protein